MRRNIALIATFSLLLSACMSTNNNQPAPKVSTNQAIGGALGAAAGAAIGSQIGEGNGNTTAMAAGTLLGAALGAQIGTYLDNMDMMYHEQTAQHALETAKSGTTLAWNNPDSGHNGTVTPVNVVQKNSGIYCREYRQNIVVNNRTEESLGTACRQADGTWKIAN